MKKLMLSALAVILCVLFAASCAKVEPSGQETGTQETADTQTPYTLTFTSNGDGTCTVTGITYNEWFEGQFTLSIPALSPDGDRVTGIDLSGTAAHDRTSADIAGVPLLLTVEAFGRIYDRVVAVVCGGDPDDFFAKKFNAYFTTISYSTLNEADRRKALAAYPFAPYVDFVLFDPFASLTETVGIKERLDEIGYTPAEYAADVREINALIQPYAPDAVISFTNASNVTSIDLPDTLTDVGPCAFRECVHITSLRLPEGIRTIGENSFAGCLKLSEISFPSTLTSLDPSAFPVYFTGESPDVIFGGETMTWEEFLSRIPAPAENGAE